jgi:hypothetical protein
MVFFVSAGALALAIAYVVAAPFVARYDTRPGAPVGQSLGIAAGVGLLFTFLYLPARRSAALESGKPRTQLLHTLVGAAGVALALAHSRGRLAHPPALVLLAAAGLLASGLYGRIVSPRRLGGAFGRGALAYRTARGEPPGARELAGLIASKQALLARLHAGAREAEFVLRTHHWVRRPLLSMGYFRLAGRERRLVDSLPAAGTAEVGLAERAWRRLHVWLAWLFVIGLLAHIVTTVFFAGYVAGDREVYWWHLRR